VATRIKTHQFNLDGEIIDVTRFRFAPGEYDELRNYVEENGKVTCESCNRTIIHLHRDEHGKVTEDYCSVAQVSGYVSVATEPYYVFDVYHSAWSDNSETHIECQECIEYGDTWHYFCDGCSRDIYYDSNYTNGENWTMPFDGDLLCVRCWDEEARRDGIDFDSNGGRWADFSDMERDGTLITDYVNEYGRWDAIDSGWHMIAVIDYGSRYGHRPDYNRESRAIKIAEKIQDSGRAVLFVKHGSDIGMFWKR
jgi:hypothetical protein